MDLIWKTGVQHEIDMAGNKVEAIAAAGCGVTFAVCNYPAAYTATIYKYFKELPRPAGVGNAFDQYDVKFSFCYGQWALIWPTEQILEALFAMGLLRFKQLLQLRSSLN